MLQSFVTTGSNANDDNQPIRVSGIDDDVSLAYSTITATFDSADVARDGGGNVIDQTVTYAGITLSGAKSDNYSLTTHTDSYRINTREVDLTATKIYDDSLVFDPANPSDDAITITASTGENSLFSRRLLPTKINGKRITISPQSYWRMEIPVQMMVLHPIIFFQQ